MYDTIEFLPYAHRCASVEQPVTLVAIRINGRDLVDIVRDVEWEFAAEEGYPDLAGKYVGLGSPEVLAPAQHLLAVPARWHTWDDDGKVAVLGCECGTPGCWPLMVEIALTADTVTWSGFEQPHRARSRIGDDASSRAVWRYDALGPFVFSRAKYEAALGFGGRVVGHMTM